MADEQSRWIIGEIADVLSTVTEQGRRRSTGEQIPHHELVALQRRKVTLLRAIAHRSPSARGVRQAVNDAEAQLTNLLTEAPTASSASSAIDMRGPAR